MTEEVEELRKEFVKAYETRSGMRTELVKRVQQAYAEGYFGDMEYDKRFVKPWLSYCMGWQVQHNYAKEKFFLECEKSIRPEEFDTFEEGLRYAWENPEVVAVSYSSISY